MLFYFNRLLTSLVNNASSKANLTSIAGVKLPKKVEQFVQEKAKLCQPDQVYLCDGSQAENDHLLSMMEKDGMVTRLPKYDNW